MDNKLQAIDPVVQSVVFQMLERSRHGQQKYGTTLARKDLALIDWLEHAKQEAMDMVNYLERAIMEIKELNEGK